MFSIKTLLRSSAIGAALGLAGWGVYELARPANIGTVGISYGEAFSPARQSNIDFHIWYPAVAGGKQVTVGGNGVFYGTKAGRRAPHDGGRHPVVVMSHGAGGNAGQFGWIASALAQEGYVVVLPNHPGTTTGNASAEAAVRVWERPLDVTAVLDDITAHADAYPFMDTDRIGVLGFSAGGYTAMALSGARVVPQKLQTFCDETDHGMSDCAFLAHFGVDLHRMDLSPAAQDLTDLRMRTAVIVDPGIVETLAVDSLTQISIPMAIINLGDEGKVPVGVDAQTAADLIPRAEFIRVNQATHFSFLSKCKARGPEILAKEGELDPLCADSGTRSRSDIHAQLVDLITDHLAEHL